VDEILPVRTDHATDMARRLAREEALFAGALGNGVTAAAILAGNRDYSYRNAPFGMNNLPLDER